MAAGCLHPAASLLCLIKCYEGSLFLLNRGSKGTGADANANANASNIDNKEAALAKATIRLPNGTVVQIDGTQEEVQHIIAFYGQTVSEQKTASVAQKKKNTVKRKHSGGAGVRRNATGPTKLITELRDSGYFKERRTLSDIQKKLEEKGFIYATTSLSPALTQLTKRGDLRRVKEQGVWKYVWHNE